MRVHRPVGPAPMTATVSPAWISASSAAQKPVERMSPAKRADSSETAAGMGVRPFSARGTRTYSAWPPSMRQPRAQPPSGSVQLFT